MYARTIQTRAARLAVITLSLFAAFASGSAAAAPSQCDANPYTPAGRICIEREAPQLVQETAATKTRHQVVKNHGSSQCKTANPYLKYIHHCR